MGTSSDRLGENEWLVHDGAAKVLFCALAWTLAQWAGSGRISANIPPQPAFIECERLLKLIQSTIDRTSHGFKGHDSISEKGHADEHGDSHGIRAVIPRTRLIGLVPTDNVAMLKSMHESLLASLMPTTGCPQTRLGNLFGEILVVRTYGKICGYTKTDLDGIKSWRSRLKTGLANGKARVELSDGLSKVFHSAAPMARILIGSTGSIERTTLAGYQAGCSLDAFQDIAVEAASKAASPIPLALLIRLARILGFSPVSDEQASVEAVAQGRAQMTEARGKVWDAWCGERDREDTLRGADKSAFATAFIAALELGALGPLPGDCVMVGPPKQVGRASKAENVRVEAASKQALIPPSRDADIVINAQRAPLDNIAMQFAPRLDGRRIVLRSIGYQIDNKAAEVSAEQRLCLQRIVVMWDWGQGMLVELDENDDNALKQALLAANPDLKIGSVELDGTNVRFGVSRHAVSEALAPVPDRAIKNLVLPPATLVPDETADHRFELWAYWHDVRFRRREADGTHRVFDRGELRDLLTQAASGEMLLQEYYAQIEQRFPTDGQLHQLGFREARVQRQPLPPAAGAAA